MLCPARAGQVKQLRSHSNRATVAAHPSPGSMYRHLLGSAVQTPYCSNLHHHQLATSMYEHYNPETQQAQQQLQPAHTTAPLRAHAAPTYSAAHPAPAWALATSGAPQVVAQRCSPVCAAHPVSVQRSTPHGHTWLCPCTAGCGSGRGAASSQKHLQQHTPQHGKKIYS
jgi:hypothetical protein